jgi:hypothetical protein
VPYISVIPHRSINGAVDGPSVSNPGLTFRGVQDLRQAIITAGVNIKELELSPADIIVHTLDARADLRITRVVIELYRRENRTPEVLKKLANAIGGEVKKWFLDNHEPPIQVTVTTRFIDDGMDMDIE